MTDVILPTCKGSPNLRAHHQRHWLILEGLGLMGGGPLAISSSEAWDVHALQCHGLVQVNGTRGGVQSVALTDAGRRMLDAREAEMQREIRLADAEARP